MCGLGGIFLFGTDSRRFNPLAMLTRIDARIAHRGPDGAGTFAAPSQRAWLCHRRLSIIDHAGGAQPMLLRQGNDPSSPVVAALAYNGCIYNQLQLRSDLSRAESEHFESDHSDTEVVLRGLARRGEAFLADMEGMFALALWTRDSHGTERLLLARDLAGEKPLYFLQLDDGVVFASSAAALIDEARHLERHAVAAENASAVLQALAFGFSDQPLFGVRELAPGSWIEFDGRGSRRSGSFAITPSTLPASKSPLT
ncbi:MAG: hypothetical protein NTV94_08890, partial [Planctomycetota bacterium]|nr:hypothetical protein [Planctomycetota bacterium]